MKWPMNTGSNSKNINLDSNVSNLLKENLIVEVELSGEHSNGAKNHLKSKQWIKENLVNFICEVKSMSKQDVLI